MRQRTWATFRLALAFAAVASATASTHAAPAAGATAAAGIWNVDPVRSELIVHVYRKGLLSPLLHDHHFVPASWTARASFDPSRPEGTHVEVVVAASSLRDRQPKLSHEDLLKVERQVAGRQILDAARYPRIEFTADRLEISPPKAPGEGNVLHGVLVGSLKLHGRVQALRVPVAARWTTSWLSVNGNASLEQSDFGIEPYSAALGAVAVHDRVDIEFSLHAAR